MYEYRATVLALVDADTLRLEIDLGLDIRHRVTVRLLGLNAPEMSTAEGKAAKQFASDWLLDHTLVTERGQVVLVRTHKDKREKYGRYLAEMLSLDGQRSLNTDLLAAGQAVPYLTGKGQL